jgi:hypothetical protein
VNEQKVIDENRRKMAKEIVDAQDPKTLEEAKRFAQNWIETAAQYAANEDYWHKQVEELRAGAINAETG